MDTLSSISHQSQGNSFLDQFPLERRSTIASRFFSAARQGATTVDAVLREVKAGAILRMVFAKRSQWNEERKLLSLLETEDSRTYAEQVLAREALPPAEKQRLKAERQEIYRGNYMRALPPTKPQLDYLRALRCETSPSNRLEASQLIEAHKG